MFGLAREDLFLTSSQKTKTPHNQEEQENAVERRNIRVIVLFAVTVALGAVIALSFGVSVKVLATMAIGTLFLLFARYAWPQARAGSNAKPVGLPVCTERNHVRLEADEIPFSLYMSDPDRFEAIMATHWEENKHWIPSEMKRRGLAWIVVTGSNVVAQSIHPSNFPDESELYALGHKAGFIAFAYSRNEKSGEITLRAMTRERRRERRAG
jgi:hypothetical protein